MRTYSVFEPPILPGSPEEDALSLRFVRHGWSLAALFFPVIWMAVRRLWWVLLAYVLLVIAIQVLSYGVPSLVTGGLSAALALIIMLEAGQLRLESMAAKGYREIAIVEGKNQKEAEQRFFTIWVHERTAGGVSHATSDRMTQSRSPVLRPDSTQSPAIAGMTR